MRSRNTLEISCLLAIGSVVSVQADGKLIGNAGWSDEADVSHSAGNGRTPFSQPEAQQNTPYPNCGIARGSDIF
jgi:hypothetical protein